MASPLSADRLLSALRAEGVRVVEHRSWRTHNRNGVGPWGPVHGVMIHHTVTSGTDASVRLCYEGRSDLPGPLCHGVIAKDGTVYLVGHGRANHAGGGDGDVLQAVIAERALPPDNSDETDGNRHFYGFECVNLGDNADPWPAAQVEAIVRASAALCRAHGWGRSGTTSVIGHLEWQPGKIDPRGPGITMAAVRTRVAERLRHPADWNPEESEEDDMPLSDDDVQRVARAVATYRRPDLDGRDARQMWDDAASPHTTWQFRPEGAQFDVYGYLTRTYGQLADLQTTVQAQSAQIALLGEALAAATGLSAAELAARLREAATVAITEAVQGVDVQFTARPTS